jgi:hypothetical protein
MSGRFWVLLVLLVVLVAGQGAILYYVSSHLTLSAALLSGAITLLVFKYVLFRRRHSGKRIG